MSLLRAKNGVGGGRDGRDGSDGRDSGMPTMRPVTMGRPLVTMSTYQERGETLKRTSIMPDDSCYRNNNCNNNNNSNNTSSNNNGSNRMSLLNGSSSNNNSSNNNSSNSSSSNNHIANGSSELPPPPPQFANPQQHQQQQQLQQKQQLKLSFSTGNKSKQLTSTSPPQLLSPVRSPSINVGGLRAPATPRPDYDAGSLVQLRSNGTASSGSSSSQEQQQQQQRRTLRLGAVTIGEYGELRGKRETLRKTPAMAGEVQSNGILKNGNRSSASFSNNSNNSSNNNNNNRQQQQAQHTEKSIKFGN